MDYTDMSHPRPTSKKAQRDQIKAGIQKTRDAKGGHLTASFFLKRSAADLNKIATDLALAHCGDSSAAVLRLAHEAERLAEAYYAQGDALHETYVDLKNSLEALR